MQSVLITLPLDKCDFFLTEIEDHFEDRDDVTLLRYGTTRRAGEQAGFIWLEFEDGPIDEDFLSQLKGMKGIRFFVLDSVVEEGEEDDDDA